MDLSIIIVSFNTRELLSDCLFSVKRAIKNLKCEVFVVDNNSWDNTVQMVRSRFGWVSLIANKKNVGFATANNQAIKKAEGKYLLILNPDTKLNDDTLTKMISFMDKDPDVAVATCKVVLPDGNLDKDCRRLSPSPWRSFCHFSGLAKVFGGSKIFDQYNMGYLSDSKQHEIDACAGAFMIVRSSAVKKVGMFDEDFFFYGEDLDWCWRFKESGYKIVYTPITNIIHYKGVASGMKPISAHLTKATRESKERAIRESTRAMELFYKKHYHVKYPFIVNLLIFFAIWLVEKIRLLRI